MNKLATLLTLPLICSTFVACSSSSKRQVEVPAGYTAKSNGSFVLQPYKEVIYDNGLKVIFVRDTTLPRVSLTMMIRAGSVLEAERVAGLNALTAYMLEQGTQKKNATQIADDFGQLGTSLDINPGNDVTTIYSDSLNTGAQDLLTFFADVVMNPAFNDREIFRMRSQMQAALQKKIDDPSSFASHKMDDFLYGKHPYARDIHGTLESLRRISKQDVIKHYLTFFRPNNASLAVVGDFDEADEKKVREVFSAWTKRTVPAVNITSAVAPTQLQVRLVVKKGLQQTQIRIAQLGIPRNHPDYLPLRLSNEILGGSFASRLNQTVRDDLGLTYSIRSYFDTKKDVGSFDISTFTKNETAGKALEETL
jgi:zinc protease